MTSAKTVKNIAFYKFVKIDEPAVLRDELVSSCRSLELKGTILIAPEGINGMLAGPAENISKFEKIFMNQKSSTEAINKGGRFDGVIFKRSDSEKIPFKRLLVKVKKEILTLRMQNVDPAKITGAYVKPQELEEWLNRGEDIVLVDTRNQFEVQYGTFKNAVDPKIKSFGQFPDFARNKLGKDKNKKIVTFCTGGIRCEKATAVMLDLGFKNVYQLEGGILEYFAKTQAKHWRGTCFVFDERIALDTNLEPAAQSQLITN
jgi:UPF0176 protein